MTHAPHCANEGAEGVAVTKARALRLILSELHRADDGVAQILDEIDDCAYCLTSVLKYILAHDVSSLRALAGEDIAIKLTEQRLKDLLDGEGPPQSADSPQ